MRPIYNFQAQAAICMHSMSWVISYLGQKKGSVGWVIVTKKLQFYIYAEGCSCRHFLTCQIQSHQPVVWGRAVAAGKFVGWLGDGETVWQQCGRCTMSNIVLWLWVCVSGLDCMHIWYWHMRTVLNSIKKERLLCVLGNRLKNHPHGAE